MKIADAICGDRCFYDAVGPAAQINRSGGERFVHGHQKITCTQNPSLGAERFLNGFAQGDAHVFDGMMLVHVKIAASVHA